MLVFNAMIWSFKELFIVIKTAFEMLENATPVIPEIHSFLDEHASWPYKY